MDFRALYFKFLILLVALWELFWSLITSIFCKVKEIPSIIMVETPLNRMIIEKCPSLKVYCPPFWARGPYAQTLAAGLKKPTNPTPYRRELVTMSDGVQIALDWKDTNSSLPENHPVILVAHGLGGHSETSSCNGMAEALKDKGWRVVVYVRRGHGCLSLLPAHEHLPQPSITIITDNGPAPGPGEKARSGKEKSHSVIELQASSPSASGNNHPDPEHTMRSAVVATPVESTAVAMDVTAAAAAVAITGTTETTAGWQRAAAGKAQGVFPATAAIAVVGQAEIEGAGAEASSSTAAVATSLRAALLTGVESTAPVSESTVKVIIGGEAIAAVAATAASNQPIISAGADAAAPSTATVVRTGPNAVDSDVESTAFRPVPIAKATEGEVAVPVAAAAVKTAQPMKGADADAAAPLAVEASAGIAGAAQPPVAAGHVGVKSMPVTERTSVSVPIAEATEAAAGAIAVEAAATAAAAAANQPIKSASVDAGAPKIKPYPAHADMDDMREVANLLAARFPNAPKFIVGLSAGSNITAYYQGRHAKESPFVAAVSVSNAHDSEEMTKFLLKDYLIDNLLLCFERKLLRERYNEVVELCKRAGRSIDWKAVWGARHIRDYYRLLLAPMYGHETVDDYFRANSCKHWIQDIEAPLLALSNLDDPIIHPDLLPPMREAAAKKPNIISVLTKHGGHLGWLHGPRGELWMHKVVCEYLEAMIEAHQAGELAV